MPHSISVKWGKVVCSKYCHRVLRRDNVVTNIKSFCMHKALVYDKWIFINLSDLVRMPLHVNLKVLCG